GNPIGLLVGKEKSGKSWLGLEMAVSTICGDSFLGRFPVRRQGPVLLLDAEYGKHETTRRFIRLARAHGREAIQLADDFDYVHARGWSIKYDRDEQPRNKVTSDVRRLVSDLREMRKAGDAGPALIVIDPLRNFLAGNENDAEAVTDFFCGLD